MQALLKTSPIHPEWLPLLEKALQQMPADYLSQLEHSEWLPGKKQIFNAFSLPKKHLRYILFGESPYPRPASANGWAFWDGAVGPIWSPSGLSKAVNRATSLRNLIKMLLYAKGLLTADFSQSAIASLDKSGLIHTLDELFQNVLKKGFLLLNATLVLSDRPVQKDVMAWRPFMASLLEQLARQTDNSEPVTVLLLGGKARTIEPLCRSPIKCLMAEHPYQISFITNETIVRFFQPFDLLVN